MVGFSFLPIQSLPCHWKSYPLNSLAVIIRYHFKILESITTKRVTARPILHGPSPGLGWRVPDLWTLPHPLKPRLSLSIPGGCADHPLHLRRRSPSPSHVHLSQPISRSCLPSHPCARPPSPLHHHHPLHRPSSCTLQHLTISTTILHQPSIASHHLTQNSLSDYYLPLHLISSPTSTSLTHRTPPCSPSHSPHAQIPDARSGRTPSPSTRLLLHPNLPSHVFQNPSPTIIFIPNADLHHLSSSSHHPLHLMHRTPFQIIFSVSPSICCNPSLHLHLSPLHRPPQPSLRKTTISHPISTPRTHHPPLSPSQPISQTSSAELPDPIPISI